MRRSAAGAVLAMLLPVLPPVAAQVPPAASADAATPAVPVGPPPAWAEMLPPAPVSTEPLDIRLFDVQIRATPGGSQRFQRTVFRANSAEALQVLGRIVLVWDPVVETPMVHKLVIRRGDETIDVLARQSFQVLRREKQLESAVVDGQLTGFVQITDLRLGDEIEYVVSVTRHNPLLGRHDEEALELGNSAVPVGRLRFRAAWPEAMPMRFRVGEGLPAAQQGKSGGERWMSIDATKYRAPDPPAGAPGRYGLLNWVFLSDFADWQQVSALFAPAYDAAATITPGSPLAAEADRIAAASSDPRRRAELALALVQRDVRYVANLGGLGAYQPAPAEDVWRDRYGDCKGKTVLLLALLRRLGITAVPALVSLRNSDGIGEALPMPGRFDHVIVRASIGGSTWWLDGTRMGDSSLDRLVPPEVRWALPVMQPGVGLVALPPQVPPEPLETETMEFTVSPDLTAPARVKAAVTYRGDSATGMATAVALLGPERTREEARQLWQKRWRDFEVSDADVTVDRTAGTVKITANGTIALEWSEDTPRTLRVPRSRVGIDLAPERKAGRFADAPVAVGARNGRNEVIMVLPRAGFTLTGEPIDVEVGGIRYVRTSALNGTRLTMTSDIRAAAHEISLAEAKAADIATDKLWERKLVLNAPEKKAAKAPAKAGAGAKAAAPAPAEAPATPAKHQVPPEVTALAEAAMAKSRTGAFDEALAIIDAAPPAVQATGDWAALKVMMLMQAGRLREADRALTAAVAKSPRDVQLLQVQAQMLVQAERLDDALIPLDRAILVAPDDPTLYRQRGQVRWRADDLAGALADFEQALALDPGNEQYQALRLSVLVEHDKPAALKALDAAIAATPDDAALHVARGRVLAKLDRKEEAKAALARAIAIEPTADAYYMRVLYELSDGPAGTIDDAEAVVRLSPSWAFNPEVAKRLVGLPGGYDRLAAAYHAAHAKAPTNGNIIAAAEVVHEAAGKPEATLLMLDTGLAVEPGDSQLLNNRCFYRAQRRLDLDKAMADCDAALKLQPGEGGMIDSRGLVWLQKGDYQKAIADYDRALALSPRMAESLYGRGLARMMLKQPEAADDFARARKADPDIDATFARYKLAIALPPAPAKPAAK